MGLHLEELLLPISDDSPCGPYVHVSGELYTDFNALELSAQGKPEQVMGGSVIPAIEPNWGEVKVLAIKLLKRTKDLYVSCYLAQSMLNSSGFAGLNEGLSLVSSLLTRYWDSVHPALIIDGDNDPDYRINAVNYLSSDAFRRDLFNTILVESRAVGQFSLKDYRIAIGEVEVIRQDANKVSPTIGLINAAFMDVPLEKLQNLRNSVSESLESAQQISRIFSEKLSDSNTPSIDPLIKDLSDILKIYDGKLSQRGASTVAGTEDALNDVYESDTNNAPEAVMSYSDEINSREDVIKHIDKICKYYERNEPSSPVPLVLGRAKQLVAMDFLEIIKNLSPESVQNIMSLAGINGE